MPAIDNRLMVVPNPVAPNQPPDSRPVRTRTVLSSVFIVATVLIVGWQAATNHSASGSTNSTSGSVASSPQSTRGTFTGTSVTTRFGDVQVQITVVGSRITEVTALHLTDADGRSVEISNRAAPILRNEVLAAQSARVATVSGATYTSNGYLTSLQSALDHAGI